CARITLSEGFAYW
nr:immunoglobulin heavy chain junction region [Mus musculus]